MPDDAGKWLVPARQFIETHGFPNVGAGHIDIVGFSALYGLDVELAEVICGITSVYRSYRKQIPAANSRALTQTKKLVTTLHSVLCWAYQRHCPGYIPYKQFTHRYFAARRYGRPGYREPAGLSDTDRVRRKQVTRSLIHVANIAKARFTCDMELWNIRNGPDALLENNEDNANHVFVLEPGKFKCMKTALMVDYVPYDTDYFKYGWSMGTYLYSPRLNRCWTVINDMCYAEFERPEDWQVLGREARREIPAYPIP